MSFDFLGERDPRIHFGDEIFQFHDAKIAFRYPDVNSVSLRDKNSNLLDDCGMAMSCAEIRRRNYAAEVDKAGGVDRFFDKYGTNPDYVRQLLNGKGVKGGRNIGDRAARKIEKMLNRPENWMDQDHTEKRSPALALNQGENDVDALRFFAAALTATMAIMRPAEARAVAAAIRLEAPDKFAKNGLLKTLLKVLDKAKKAKTGPREPSA